MLTLEEKMRPIMLCRNFVEAAVRADRRASLSASGRKHLHMLAAVGDRKARPAATRQYRVERHLLGLKESFEANENHGTARWIGDGGIVRQGRRGLF